LIGELKLRVEQLSKFNGAKRWVPIKLKDEKTGEMLIEASYTALAKDEWPEEK
jgi:hypothetical protein